MIPLTLGEAICAYTTALVGLLLLIMLARALGRARRVARARRRQIQCAVCGTIYEDLAATALPPCPICSRPNERYSQIGL